jgi:hypothetical protein
MKRFTDAHNEITKQLGIGSESAPIVHNSTEPILVFVSDGVYKYIDKDGKDIK